MGIPQWGLATVVATIVLVLPSGASPVHAVMDRAASRAGIVRVAEVGRGEHGDLTRTRMVLSLRGGGPRFTGGEEEDGDLLDQVRLTCPAGRTRAWSTFETVVAGLLHDPVRPPSEGSHISFGSRRPLAPQRRHAIVRVASLLNAAWPYLTEPVDAQALQSPARDGSKDAAGGVQEAVAAVAAAAEAGGGAASSEATPMGKMLQKAKTYILSADEAINMLPSPRLPRRSPALPLLRCDGRVADNL